MDFGAWCRGVLLGGPLYHHWTGQLLLLLHPQSAHQDTPHQARRLFVQLPSCAEMLEACTRHKGGGLVRYWTFSCNIRWR